jgi:malonyl-CoA/methylmalonyl-CoA synthetase
LVRILTGSQGEIVPTYPNPAVIWARLRQGGITSVAGVSYFWEQLAKYFSENLDQLPAEEREHYIKGANGVARSYIAGSAPAPWLLPFWKKTFNRIIQVGYVATELGVLTMMTPPNPETFIEVGLMKRNQRSS